MYVPKYLRNIPEICKESFVIEIDQEYEDGFEPLTPKDEFDFKLDYGDLELIEMAKCIYTMEQKEIFSRYIDWYVDMYQGTLEQPYKLFDETGELLTAYSYYNHQNNSMAEMKLIFDQGQTDNVKKLLTDIGFLFDSMRYYKALVPVEPIINKISKFGSVETPYILLNGEEEYYAYGPYEMEKKQMQEMRLVFDSTQIDTIKSYLKLGGFIV